MKEPDIEYEVEAILDDKIEKKRTKNGKYEYLVKFKVKWVGYPISESTWEPLENLTSCQKIIQNYYRKKKIKTQSSKHMINKKTRCKKLETGFENENFETIINHKKNNSKTDSFSFISSRNNQYSPLAYSKKNKEVRSNLKKPCFQGDQSSSESKKCKNIPKRRQENRLDKKPNTDEILTLEEEETYDDEKNKINDKKVEKMKKNYTEYNNSIKKYKRKKSGKIINLDENEENLQKTYNNRKPIYNINQLGETNSKDNLLDENGINLPKVNNNLMKEERNVFEDEKEDKIRIFGVSGLEIPKNKDEKFTIRVEFGINNIRKNTKVDIFSGIIPTDITNYYLKNYLISKYGEAIIKKTMKLETPEN